MKETEIITTKKLIGQRLRAEREYQRISMYKMRKMTGLHWTDIKGVEEGSTRYAFDTYLKVMAALNCSFVIINGRGNNSGLIQIGLDDTLQSL